MDQQLWLGKSKTSVKESLKKMRLEDHDLVCLYQLFSDFYEAYQALYHEGKIKAIGVSNFYPDGLVD